MIIPRSEQPMGESLCGALIEGTFIVLLVLCWRQLQEIIQYDYRQLHIHIYKNINNVSTKTETLETIECGDVLENNNNSKMNEFVYR